MSKEMEFDKERFIRLMQANIEYNSSSVTRAREFLKAEGVDVDSFLKKGLKRIHDMQNKSSSTFEMRAVDKVEIGQSKRRKWTHKSVVRLMEESGNEDPLDEIKKRARELVVKAFEMGWDGPPFNPVKLAELNGIEVTPNDAILDGRIIPQKKGFQIQYNPFQKPTRINFSIAHEIAHSLLSDCADTIRNREEDPAENRQLEQLCNTAAAEIQLPYAVFSHDANAAPPSIEGLIDLATRYRASLESVFIRYTEVIDRPCAVLIGIFQDDDRIVLDYHKTSRHLRLLLPDGFTIPPGSKAYECTSPGWTAREQIRWGIFQNVPYNMFAVGISPYRRDKKSRVGILILPTETYDLSPEVGKISLEIGDATKPRGKGKKIIAQVVNTSAALGRGFGYSLTKNYPVVKDALKKWQADKKDFYLGSTNLVQINEELFVFQMLAQKGIFAKGDEIPLKYNELRKCLIALRYKAMELNCSVHMPAIGSGNAGGDWNIIIGMIHDELVNYDIKVNIYLFQGKSFNPKEKTTLTIFKEDSTWQTGK